MIAADDARLPQQSSCRSMARRRPARGRARGRRLDRRGTGAALVVRDRHRGAGHRRRRQRSPPTSCGICGPAGGSASASTCATPASSSAASAICGSTASRRTSIATRPSALYRDRRRTLDPAAHQPAASSRRHAEAARRRIRPRLGAARDRRMERVRAGGRRGQGRPRRHRDALVCGMGRAPARPRGGAPAAVLASNGSATRRPSRCPGRSAARRRQGAGPDPRDRRAGVRPHARGPWRRRAEHLAPRICRRWRRW